jgi:hypothetical protein
LPPNASACLGARDVDFQRIDPVLVVEFECHPESPNRAACAGPTARLASILCHQARVPA